MQSSTQLGTVLKLAGTLDRQFVYITVHHAGVG